MLLNLSYPRSGLSLSSGGLGSSSPPPVSNLLQWTQVFDNAVWLQTAVFILPDNASSPIGDLTADLISGVSAASAVRQISTTAATTGAGANLGIFDVATDWTRYQVTAAFDSVDYVFSVYLKQTEVGIGGRIRIDRSGGFIRCSLEDVGDAGAYWAWGAQLELGTTATAYVARTT